MNKITDSLTQDAPIIILGSGLAAFTLAREFRKLDKTTPITLITREEGYFYSKPMLSTAFANKKLASQLISTSAENMATQLEITILGNTHVHKISPTIKQIETSEGIFNYSKLVLTLGSDTIKVNFSETLESDMISVNDLSDYAKFREITQENCRVAILGAGLIGCEFANDLRIGGHEVDVIDLASQPLGRLLPELAAKEFKAKLSEMGIRWHLGTSIEEVKRLHSGLQIILNNGDIVEADVLLSAIGLRPRISLAKDAGVSVNRGIVVDEFLQTSEPSIYALGDCAEVKGHILPYVMPIMHSAKALAQTLNGTKTAVSYPAMPIMVKTPAVPTVVSPPMNTEGSWKETQIEGGVESRFEDEAGNLLGFALIGTATAQRSTLVKLLPAILT